MNLLPFILLIFFHNVMFGQATDPIPAQCGGAGSPTPPNLIENCGHNSTLWSNNARHFPHADARPIRVKVNFIILQKIDGSGNFQDIPEHIAFLNDWLDACNQRFDNLWGTASTCTPLAPQAKVQIVPNWIFKPDPDQTEFNWNNDNEPSQYKCPNDNSWWLNGLDNTLNNNPSIPKGINVYLTVDGSVYNQMVVLGTVDNPAGMTYWWCSETPSRTNLAQPSRVSVVNLFLKYWWFQNHPESVVPGGVPFSISRQWLVGEGGILAHEPGHSFSLLHIGCTHNLMTMSGGDHNTMTRDQVGQIHRYFATSSLRQFIECDETYNPFNMPSSSTDFDRVVSTNELWDLNM